MERETQMEGTRDRQIDTEAEGQRPHMKDFSTKHS